MDSHVLFYRFGLCSNHASIQHAQMFSSHFTAVTAWLNEPSLSLMLLRSSENYSVLGPF